MFGILSHQATHSPALRFTINSSIQISVRNATKKAGGSTNNGRDSAGRRLGIKVWPGKVANPGNIIVRQRGKKFLAGENVRMGNDHTLFAVNTGVVKMTKSEKNHKRNVVHVLAEDGSVSTAKGMRYSILF